MKMIRILSAAAAGARVQPAIRNRLATAANRPDSARLDIVGTSLCCFDCGDGLRAIAAARPKHSRLGAYWRRSKSQFGVFRQNHCPCRYEGGSHEIRVQHVVLWQLSGLAALLSPRRGDPPPGALRL